MLSSACASIDAISMQRAMTEIQTQPASHVQKCDRCLDNICNAYRFELAKASRVWRQGVPTALIMNQEMHMLQDPAGIQVILSSSAPAQHASLQAHDDTRLSQKGCMHCQDTGVNCHPSLSRHWRFHASLKKTTPGWLTSTCHLLGQHS